MIRCRDNTIYTGITTDIKRRMSEHISGHSRSAKYTRTHKPENIIALWQCGDRSNASKLEYQIKALSKAQKERLSQNGDLSIFSDKINVVNFIKVFEPY